MATGTAIVCRASAVPDILSMAARLMQQKETASDCPKPRGAQIYGTQAKVIIVNENPGSCRGYFGGYLNGLIELLNVMMLVSRGARTLAACGTSLIFTVTGKLRAPTLIRDSKSVATILHHRVL